MNVKCHSFLRMAHVNLNSAVLQVKSQFNQCQEKLIVGSILLKRFRSCMPSFSSKYFRCSTAESIN